MLKHTKVNENRLGWHIEFETPVTAANFKEACQAAIELAKVECTVQNAVAINFVALGIPVQVTEADTAETQFALWERRVSQLAFFEVAVGFGTVGRKHENSPLGVWAGLANDRTEAERLALEELWDERLTAGDAAPRVRIEEIPRYMASHGWGHIFVGTREETTRWIYDRGVEALVAAQVLNGSSWINLDAAPMVDLLESIHDNDAIEDADNFGLIQSSSLPSWQEVENHSMTNNQVEANRG